MTEIPTHLRLACEHDVPHQLGQAIYNYYDMMPGTINQLAKRPEPDTSGQLPEGVAWWVDTTAGFIDGSRMCCIACAEKKGWTE